MTLRHLGTCPSIAKVVPAPSHFEAVNMQTPRGDVIFTPPVQLCIADSDFKVRWNRRRAWA